jgi:hypothetical protein
MVAGPVGRGGVRGGVTTGETVENAAPGDMNVPKMRRPKKPSGRLPALPAICNTGSIVGAAFKNGGFSLKRR